MKAAYEDGVVHQDEHRAHIPWASEASLGTGPEVTPSTALPPGLDFSNKNQGAERLSHLPKLTESVGGTAWV